MRTRETEEQTIQTHRHGAQGTFDGASNSTLDNEFGTHEAEAVIKTIIEKGTVQESEVRDPPQRSVTYTDHTAAGLGCFLRGVANVGISNTQMEERQGSKNDSKGVLGGH